MNQTVEPNLKADILARLREQRLPCEDVFAIAREQRIKPRQVATRAGELGVRIGWCQLGLFAGANKEEKQVASPEEVSPALRAQLESVQEEGGLTCARAWAVARRLGLERIEVGRATDALGMRIGHCQLGCFD